MKKNKNKVSTQKRKTFYYCLFYLIYGIAIGLFIATPFADTLRYGLLSCAFLMSMFGVVDLFVWRFGQNEKRKKSKK